MTTQHYTRTERNGATRYLSRSQKNKSTPPRWRFYDPLTERWRELTLSITLLEVERATCKLTAIPLSEALAHCGVTTTKPKKEKEPT